MKKKLNISKKFFPVNEPVITRENIKDVTNSIKSGWISSDGKDVINFEKKFSKFIGKKYGVTVSNGTAALEVAVRSLNLKSGSHIIIPNFSIISTALAVIKNGHIPILIDCELDTWNMKISEIEKKISKQTKCIIATHIYGYPCEVEKIKKLCKKNKIFLIEDAAEMIGHKYKKKYCGNYGDLSIFSFYANKHITTGEGGMIVTNNKNLYKKCKSLRNLCFGFGDKRFYHNDIGWNYRMTNIQSALGLSQLKNIKNIIKKKIEIGKKYYNNLRNIKNIFIQKPVHNKIQNVYWVVGVLIKKKIDIKNLRDKLLKKGVQTRPFFFPMHKQPILKKYLKFNRGNFGNSEIISKNGFYLPSGLNLKNEDINQISNIFKKII